MSVFLFLREANWIFRIHSVIVPQCQECQEMVLTLQFNRSHFILYTTLSGERPAS